MKVGQMEHQTLHGGEDTQNTWSRSGPHNEPTLSTETTENGGRCMGQKPINHTPTGPGEALIDLGHVNQNTTRPAVTRTN